MKLYFLSRDANWQHYRNETLTYLGRKYKVKVEILTTDHLKPYLKENEVLKYRRFKNWFSPNNKLNFFPGSIWYIIKNRPDCVLALNNSTNLTEYLAVLICRVLGIRFVWWTHAYDHKPLKNKAIKIIKNLYVYLFLHLGNAIVVFSPSGKDHLLKKGFNRSNIFVAPNTLDTEKLTNLRKRLSSNFDKQKFIVEHFGSLPKTSRFILFSGRVNHFKKVNNLIKCLSILLQKRDNVYLVIIGSGPKMQEVKELTNELLLTNRVFFRGSVFDDEEVGRYFLLSDVFVIPGLVGLAIVHAFAYGKPLFTENISYHSPEIQYLKNGVNGYIVPEDDISGMASLIDEVLSDNQKMYSLSRNAISTVERDAAISNMISEMYKAILPKKH